TTEQREHGAGRHECRALSEAGRGRTNLDARESDLAPDERDTAVREVAEQRADPSAAVSSVELHGVLLLPQRFAQQVAEPHREEQRAPGMFLHLRFEA